MKSQWMTTYNTLSIFSIAVCSCLPLVVALCSAGVLSPVAESTSPRRDSAEELRCSCAFRVERVGGSRGGILGPLS